MDQKDNKPYKEQEFNFSNISNQTLYSVLAYIFILWIIGLLVDKNNKIVRFHVNQGIILSVVLSFSLVIIKCIADVLYFIAPVLAIFSALLEVLWLAFAIIFISIGIKNALKHEQTPLPIFGNLFVFVK